MQHTTKEQCVRALVVAEHEYLEAIRASTQHEPGAGRRLAEAKQTLDDLSEIVQVLMGRTRNQVINI